MKPQLRREVVSLAKTLSRRELQERFNVPGPTIRLLNLSILLLFDCFELLFDYQDVAFEGPRSALHEEPGA